MIPDEQKDRITALVDLASRAGASTWRLEYTDEANGPVVWVAVAELHPAVGGGLRVGCGIDPHRAAHDLCERMVDGSICRHCGRVSILEAFDATLDNSPPPDRAVCWYCYDPELRTYRRSCEGDHP